MQVARCIGLDVNPDKTMSMCFNEGSLSSASVNPLKVVGQYIYLSSNISSIESHVNIHIGVAWGAIERLWTIWISDLSDKIKQEFFQAVAVSVLVYGFTS